MSYEGCRRINGTTYQEHVVRTYEVTDRNGLPVTFVGEETITLNKSNRCIGVLRASAGTVGAGIGASIGWIAGPLLFGSIASGWIKSVDHKSGNDYLWVLGIAASSTIVGMGVGAIAGKKISICAFNCIFGKK